MLCHSRAAHCPRYTAASTASTALASRDVLVRPPAASRSRPSRSASPAADARQRAARFSRLTSMARMRVRSPSRRCAKRSSSSSVTIRSNTESPRNSSCSLSAEVSLRPFSSATDRWGQREVQQRGDPETGSPAAVPTPASVRRCRSSSCLLQCTSGMADGCCAGRCSDSEKPPLSAHGDRQCFCRALRRLPCGHRRADNFISRVFRPRLNAEPLQRTHANHLFQVLVQHRHIHEAHVVAGHVELPPRRCCARQMRFPPPARGATAF